MYVSEEEVNLKGNFRIWNKCCPALSRCSATVMILARFMDLSIFYFVWRNTSICMKEYIWLSPNSYTIITFYKFLWVSKFMARRYFQQSKKTCPFWTTRSFFCLVSTWYLWPIVSILIILKYNLISVSWYQGPFPTYLINKANLCYKYKNSYKLSRGEISGTERECILSLSSPILKVFFIIK